MKIFLGPAGIPFIAKNTSTAEGVKTVSGIGLNAMEIEFVQKVYLSNDEAKEIGKIAKDHGVRLSVHAPYYINLCSKTKSIVEASKKRIINSLMRADAMEADAIAVHAAYYSGSTKEQAYEKIKQELIGILDRVKPNAKLGIETMGRKSQFGSLDETIRLHDEIKGIVPYIDWGHLFVRNNGKIDYGGIFEKLKGLNHINSQFTCVSKNKKGEFIDVHLPIAYDTPPFESLAKEILRRKIDITIICESPLIDVDSLLMKLVFEKLGYEF